MSKVKQNEEMVRLAIIRQLIGKRLWVDENGNDWHIEDVSITQLHQEDELIACINKRTPVYDLGDATILTHDDINAYGIEEGYVLELEHKGDIIEDPSFVLIYNPKTCRADIYRINEAAPENWLPITFFFMS